MKPIIQKTLGGLTKQYYFRHFTFGLIFTGLIVFMQLPHLSNLSGALPILVIAMINAFLYPYARFVYESIVRFIMGDTILISAALPALFFKLIMMVFCWGLSIFIAPIGLAYLYYHHSKQENIS